MLSRGQRLAACGDKVEGESDNYELTLGQIRDKPQQERTGRQELLLVCLKEGEGVGGRGQAGQRGQDHTERHGGQQETAGTKNISG